MLREQNGQLADFLTTDPKGKLHSGISLDHRFRCNWPAKQAEMIAKMESVGQHIEHIKEIVAMQQSYAKVSGRLTNNLPG